MCVSLLSLNQNQQRARWVLLLLCCRCYEKFVWHGTYFSTSAISWLFCDFCSRGIRAVTQNRGLVLQSRMFDIMGLKKLIPVKRRNQHGDGQNLRVVRPSLDTTSF